jgi:hypothetical protein
MRQRLPIVLSVTALLVAVLGWTGVGEAAKQALFPKNSVDRKAIAPNSVASSELVNKGVKRKDLKKNIITSAYVQNNTLKGEDIRNESLKGEDILDESIEGEDIFDESLEGEDIDESSLGIVPEADKVDGKDATCPGGTAEIADLCMETSSRPPANWTSAATECGKWGGRLPTADELYYARTWPGLDLDGTEISSTLYDDGGSMEYVSVMDDGTIGAPGAEDSNPYRCAKDVLN